MLSTAKMAQTVRVGNINDCTDFDAFQNLDLKAQCAVSAVTDEITKRSTSNKNTSSSLARTASSARCSARGGRNHYRNNCISRRRI